jgi:glycine cleavage system H protein
VVEAVKAVSDLYSPLTGEVTEVNGALDADPGLINRDPYDTGWMVKLRIKDPDSLTALLTPEAYKAQIGE